MLKNLVQHRVEKHDRNRVENHDRNRVQNSVQNSVQNRVRKIKKIANKKHVISKNYRS